MTAMANRKQKTSRPAARSQSMQHGKPCSDMHVHVTAGTCVYMSMSEQGCSTSVADSA